MNAKYHATYMLLERASMSKTKTSAIGGGLIGTGVGLMVARDILSSAKIKEQVGIIADAMRKAGHERAGKTVEISAPVIMGLIVTATIAALTSGVSAAVTWISEKLQKKGQNKTEADAYSRKMGKIVRKSISRMKKIAARRSDLNR